METNKSMLDSGGFNMVAELDFPNIKYYALDIWKYKPEKYTNRYLNSKSIWARSQIAGLWFIDSKETPIIHTWQESLPGLPK